MFLVTVEDGLILIYLFFAFNCRHPDKFLQVFGSRLSDIHRDAILLSVNTVSQLLNSLSSEGNATSRDLWWLGCQCPTLVKYWPHFLQYHLDMHFAFWGVRTCMHKYVILCKAFCVLGKALPMFRVRIVESHQQREEDVFLYMNFDSWGWGCLDSERQLSIHQMCQENSLGEVQRYVLDRIS